MVHVFSCEFAAHVKFLCTSTTLHATRIWEPLKNCLPVRQKRLVCTGLQMLVWKFPQVTPFGVLLIFIKLDVKENKKIRGKMFI